MTVLLSCHVPNFVDITVLELGWKQNEIFIESKLRRKNSHWNGCSMKEVNPLKTGWFPFNIDTFTFQVIIVDADGLVRKHQGIGSNNIDYYLT